MNDNKPGEGKKAGKKRRRRGSARWKGEGKEVKRGDEVKGAKECPKNRRIEAKNRNEGEMERREETAWECKKEREN